MSSAHKHGGKALGSLATRLVWFAALWLAGLLAVGAVALLIRSVLL
ncbi:MAG: DUF2474 domain-containing protein [Candidatus Rokuibacteriota bacterium]|nr:MAG: DUF2474 domain-containing protein [Candidatus Rokubacteria bacterium]